KALVAQTRNMSSHPLVAAANGTRDATAPAAQEYVDEGRHELGVAARIPQLGWTVIVEQPTAEAYATATVLQRQLYIVIFLALAAMIAVGWLFGRSFINPILALPAATHDVAAGELGTRAAARPGDDSRDPAEPYNPMADQLAKRQEAGKRQERQAMFGRVAAGLVHDLSPPIQNIGNSPRLLLRDDV